MHDHESRKMVLSYQNDIIYDDTSPKLDNESSGDKTYLDLLSDQLVKMGIDDEVTDKLMKYMLTQQFDSECMDYDVNIEPVGNIENFIENQKCIGLIKGTFRKSTSMNDILYVLCT